MDPNTPSKTPLLASWKVRSPNLPSHWTNPELDRDSGRRLTYPPPIPASPSTRDERHLTYSNYDGSVYSFSGHVTRPPASSWSSSRSSLPPSFAFYGPSSRESHPQRGASFGQSPPTTPLPIPSSTRPPASSSSSSRSSLPPSFAFYGPTPCESRHQRGVSFGLSPPTTPPPIPSNTRPTTSSSGRTSPPLARTETSLPTTPRSLRSTQGAVNPSRSTAWSNGGDATEHPRSPSAPFLPTSVAPAVHPISPRFELVPIPERRRISVHESASNGVATAVSTPFGADLAVATQQEQLRTWQLYIRAAKLKPRVSALLARLPRCRPKRKKGRSSYWPSVPQLPWSPLDTCNPASGCEKKRDIWVDTQEQELEDEVRGLQKELWALNGDRVIEVGKASERADGVAIGALGLVLTIQEDCEELMEQCWNRLGNTTANGITSKSVDKGEKR